ncbi:UNVERIFIED_CONTAM: F-box protein PP2-A13 [Sesamum radiatum]|uniref:F-box protein PP2-A13 n=1 Tax=Sesamum radiatum TaxID=300843 RepID=A0AAW2V9J8_SESRA
MGANASSLPGGAEGPSPRAKLEDIPESCMALVLSYLDPPEIAKLARLNRAFRAASSADFIWVPKLPSNYRYIPRQEVWIDKRTGGVCLAISSKAMAITGIDDRRYWNHITTGESRFQTVAYLHQIWWLEVDGDLEFQFPRGTYSLFFRLQLGRVGKRLGRRVCNSENVHGWDIKPVQFQLTTEDGQHAVSRCMLDNLGYWVHFHVGDFTVEDPEELTKIKFSLTQIDCTHTKGGLCVDSVFICPSSLGKVLFPVDGEACKKL